MEQMCIPSLRAMSASNSAKPPSGPVMMAADAVHEPFAVINADDFYGAEAYKTIRDAIGDAVCSIASRIVSRSPVSYMNSGRSVCSASLSTATKSAS